MGSESPWTVRRPFHGRTKRKILFSPTKTSPDFKRLHVQASSEYLKWTDEEKSFLVQFAEGKNKVDWLDCAEKLLSKYGNKRSDKTCHMQFKRMIGIKRKSCEVAVQTDICVGFGESLEVVRQVRPRGEDHTLLHRILTEDLSRTNMNTEESRSIVRDSPTHVPESVNGQIVHVVRDSPTHLPGSVNGQETVNDSINSSVCIDALQNDCSETETTEHKDHTYFLEKPKTTKNNNKAGKKRIKANFETITNLKQILASTVNDHDESSTSEKHCNTAEACMSDPGERKKIISLLGQEMSKVPEKMKNRKKGFVSVLMKKDFDSLQNFNLKEIISEFKAMFPELFQLLIAVMIPSKRIEEAIGNAIPRLALIYSVVMQSRIKELSRFQRTVALTLADNICDQAVFDRLNRLGVTVPYCVALKTFSEVGERYPNLIADALKQGKYVRLIGDNLNISVGTSHETQSEHKHMKHMFTSTCLVSEHYFMDKPEIPEINFDNLSITDILISKDEYLMIRDDVTTMIFQTVSKYLPQISHLQQQFPKTVVPPQENIKKTEIIPLPCLPYNEQKYQDDIKILEWYQQLCEKVIQQSGIDKDTTFQIGGDQLTRERFSEALLLRLDNIDPKDRFSSIGRCTAEFFHLSMNFLEKAIFEELWNKEGEVEMGTLRGECERISRKGVDPNIMKAYDDDKRFVFNYVDALTVEGMLQYMNMEDTNDIPQGFPTNTTEEDQFNWLKDTIGQFIDKYIFPCWSGETDQSDTVLEDSEGVLEIIKVQLADGSTRTLTVGEGRKETIRCKENDKVKDYAHFAAEVGIIFKYLQELIQRPHRERLLAILKMMMLLLKGHSVNAKYPREILRMLVQQYSVFGLREACTILQACFVNLRGKDGTNVPADLVQEWNVRESKAYIKHMFSNKTNENIIKKTAALPCIHQVSENLEKEIGALVRAKRHKKKESVEDELKMMADLRKIKPFLHTEGRFFNRFNRIPRSLVTKVDGYQLNRWFERNKGRFFN